MKKILLSIFILIGTFSLSAQTLISTTDELILPKYMVNGSASSSRIQYACRLKLSGLTANTVYRYTTGASTNAALTTGTAPGNMFAINNAATTAGYIVGYTSNKTPGGTLFSGNENVTVGRYAEFTTDANGSYTGWFAIVPTGNAVFTAGNDLFFYVQLNAGAGGTTITQSYRTTSTIRCLGYGTTANTNSGTALKGFSFAAAETMVFGYDTIGARPVFGTWVEDDGITTTHTMWYNQTTGGVDGAAGAWGTVIPNDMPKGIIRIENYNINGTVNITNNSSTGVWGTTSTVNVSGGTTPITIASTDAPLPVQFKSFIAVKSNDALTVKWTTVSEKNNKGFEVQRSVNGSKFTAIGFVKGAGNSNTINAYSFVDVDKNAGSVCYRLKQVDFDGKSTYSKNACVTVETEKVSNAAIVTPNPFKGTLSINYLSNASGSVTVQLIDMLGKVHLQTTELVQNGENVVNINTESLPEGIYFARIDNGVNAQTIRVIKK